MTLDDVRNLTTRDVQLAGGDMGRIVAIDPELENVVVETPVGPYREIHISRLIHGPTCVIELDA